MSHVEEGTLHAMLDGELAGDEVASLKAHLDTCAQCRALLDEVKEFVAEADTLIVSLDEHTAPAEEGGQSDRRSGGQVGGKAVGRYGGNVRPWYRQPQFLAAAATITLAIGAGYIGLALRSQGMVNDQPELVSEADARAAGTSAETAAETAAGAAGAARAAGAVEQLRADAGKEQTAKDEISAGTGETRQRAEPSDVTMESEEAEPAPAVLAAPAALADTPAVTGRRIANEGNVAAAAPPTDDGLDEAMDRLGSSIKLIDGRRPVRIEQEAAPTLEGATAAGGMVRVVYQDEEDREFVLEQVKVSFDNDTADDKRNQPAEAQKAAAFADRDAFLRVTPNDTVISAETDSTVRIRWVDADGIMLALIGVDEGFLRKMMGRIQ